MAITTIRSAVLILVQPFTGSPFRNLNESTVLSSVITDAEDFIELQHDLSEKFGHSFDLSKLKSTATVQDLINLVTATLEVRSVA